MQEAVWLVLQHPALPLIRLRPTQVVLTGPTQDCTHLIPSKDTCWANGRMDRWMGGWMWQAVATVYMGKLTRMQSPFVRTTDLAK